MRRKFITVGLVMAGCVVVTVALLSSDDKAPSTAPPLLLRRQQIGAIDPSVSVLPTNVIRDFLREKYAPTQRAQFHLSSGNQTAIFVWATGVEVLTDSGWKQYSEDYRGEIWSLKPGTAYDMFVETPDSEQICRAYIRYGAEMHGPPLFRAKVREAWGLRSFTNWTGKPLPGRFSGQYRLVSEEFSK